MIKLDRAGYAMLMSPNKDKKAVHGCHGDMVVRIRKVVAIPWSLVVCASVHILV